MKPVAILRFFPLEGPGYFATFLDQHHIPWQLICLDKGMLPPNNPRGYSGLVLMGGPMSVHDDLPWINLVLSLIRQTVAIDIPVLGHCLGGQLLSTALGGIVTSNPVKEIGWGQVHIEESTPIAQDWFGSDLSEFDAFHWHGETFSIPANAVRLLSSPYCPNQAFALGIHLGMQCHIEMTAAMVKAWCEANIDELLRNHGNPAVSSSEEIQTNLEERITALQSVADRLYKKWITALKN
ncbi:type 1 glutamine amidotransferase [Nitrosomonas eutropha]|uniref:GMP synthase-like glutamine amidotransferase n=2 Tax=Nitrosomonas eutropha TaxID=916 RepID=A0ABX5MAG8_9PROT|nr:type 1 glutamine amidotransferase [Nitrosomonas eutropha]ABI59288.1 glutamine amidotransferase class-I [Nitrosomonas eutropha C91]PXV81075.1 GMP synthase-like glutamine amidotransferase [Nitrosomonas eutropha]SCX26602.1 GMP synthase-Glutamine amidotransferase [Nitrosomonas eutropha]SEI97009.1 GMP synthase-Glutamine amidotransferase [Nitrosomonas eutropha]